MLNRQSAIAMVRKCACHRSPFLGKWRVILIAITLCAMLPMQAQAADYQVDGVTYFVLNDQKAVDMQQLIADVVMRPYNRNGSNKSLIDRWSDLAVMLSQVNEPYAFANYFDTSIISGDINGYSRITNLISSGVASADESLRYFAGDSLGIGYHAGPTPGLASDTKEQPVVYGLIAPKAGGATKLRDIYEAYGVILSDFQLLPVITGDYIGSIPESAWVSEHSYVPSSTTPSYVTNTANELVQHKVTLKKGYTETMSNSFTSAHTLSLSEAVTVGTSVTIIPKIWTASVSSTFTWSNAWSESVMTGTAKTATVDATTDVSVTLPPHTRAVVSSGMGKHLLKLAYDYPLALSYKATIVHYMLTKPDKTYVNAAFAFEAHNSSQMPVGSTDARTDLLKRSAAGYNDPYFKFERTSAPAVPFHYPYVSPRSIAEDIGKAVPMSIGGAMLNYQQEGFDTNVGTLQPLYDLKRVAVDGARSIGMNVNEQLIVDDIKIKGLDGDSDLTSAPYYGFASSLGKWQLLDSQGNPTTSSSIVSIQTDPIMKETTLTAKGAGVVYLKYLIDENAYKSVDPDGHYIRNQDLSSTAIIKITIPKGNDEAHEIRATGAVTGFVGQSIDLRTYQGLTAHLVDRDGEKLPVPIVWEAKEDASQGIKIEADGRTLTLSKAGIFHIRATANGAASDWLTATARYAATNLALSPDQLLMGIGDTVQLTPSLMPDGIKETVDYTSSNPAIASVNAQGRVTAHALGGATIKATIPNGGTATCAIVVEQNPIRPTVIADTALIPEAQGGGADLDVSIFNVTGQLGVTFVVKDDRGDEALRLPATVANGIARFALAPGQLKSASYTVWVESPGNAQNRGLIAAQIGKLAVRSWPTVSGSNRVTVLPGSLVPIPLAMRLNGSDPDNDTSLCVSLGNQVAQRTKSGDGDASVLLLLPVSASGELDVFASAPATSTQHAIAETRIGVVTVLDKAALLGGDLAAKFGAGWVYGQAASAVPVAVKANGATLDSARNLFGTTNADALSVGVNWPRSSGVIGRIERARWNPLALSKAAQSVPRKPVLTVNGKIDKQKDYASFAFSAQEMSRLEPGYYTFSVEAKPDGEFKGFAPLTLMSIEVKGSPSPKAWTIPATLRISAGQQYQLARTVLDGGPLPALTVSSANKKIATITSAGMLTAKEPGGTTITVRSADGSMLKCKLTVVSNSFSRSKPLYISGKAGLFTSTRKLSYSKGKLLAEVFLYNRTGATLRGADAWAFELYDGETLIYRRPIGTLTFKTTLKHKKYALYKLQITDDMLPGISRKPFDLGSKRFQAVIRSLDRNGNQAIPLIASVRGAVQAKSIEALPNAAQDAVIIIDPAQL